jgi:BirA family transcriptional regulator, biotin operon repressor / biotin---[acetyl-CoA-carboxylase] ligase
MQLDALAIDADVRLVAHDTIGSTNSEAKTMAQRGERGPLWVTAARQTAGRGRMDRSWISPAGNLYASLLLTDPSPVERASELAFVAALAVRDAIIVTAPPLASELGFKWPNDLLANGEKCAGILIEGEVAAAGQDGTDKHLSVVIGIGVNCASHPPDTAFPATDLLARGAKVAPEQLFMPLSATMCRRIAQWDHGRGFPAILGDWLTSARGLGEDITVRNGGAEKRGRFAGLDQSGRLVLELPGGGTEKISAGDVFPFGLRSRQREPGQA